MIHGRYEELCENGWPKLDLPVRIEDFVKQSLDEVDRKNGVLFRYEDKDKKWYIYGMYSEETDDYLVRYDIGLTEITEMDLIEIDSVDFRRALETTFAEIVKRRWFGKVESISEILFRAGVMDEPWETVLPNQIGTYYRKLAPDKPIRGLNGSYLIGLYADARNDRGLIFYYNIFRNDFFAEMYCNRVPFVIHDFDAPNRTVLVQKIEQNLQAVLERLSGVKTD